jgi:hypothetical protein
MYYTKLDTFSIDINLFDYAGYPGKIYPGTTKDIWLRYFQFNNVDIYNNHFPKFTDLVPDTILLAEISGKGYIGPHMDHGPKCVLNWYYNSNDCITYFHVKKPNAKGIVLAGETEPNVFYSHEVTKVNEFTAKDNEAYLLNVSEIHSVLSNQEGVRRFVSLGWSKYCFDDVLESIRLYQLRN